MANQMVNTQNITTSYLLSVLALGRKFDVQHTSGVVENIRHRLLANDATLLDVACSIQNLLFVLEDVLAAILGTGHRSFAALESAVRESALAGVILGAAD